MLIASFTGRINTLELHGSHDGKEASEFTIYFTIHTTDGVEFSTLGKGWSIAEATTALEMIANGAN